jgi:hypothetical protein
MVSSRLGQALGAKVPTKVPTGKCPRCPEVPTGPGTFGEHRALPGTSGHLVGQTVGTAREKVPTGRALPGTLRHSGGTTEVPTTTPPPLKGGVCVWAVTAGKCPAGHFGGIGSIVAEVTIMQGDCRERLAELAPESVHCCVTSPPYLGLRVYPGAEPLVWGSIEGEAPSGALGLPLSWTGGAGTGEAEAR